MPYSVPSSPSTSSAPSSTTTTTTTVASPRLSHRRTRSSGATFSDELGPGAFVSLGTLPKRKPTQKKALFHFNEEQDHQEEANDDSSHNSQQKSFPSLFLSLPARDSVPFPSSSSLLSPLSPTEPQHSPLSARSPLPRNSSSPIILSNGKPLKSSLKSSASSPHIPQITHLRAQSAPATPNVLKNVHFAESDDGLESVRVYNRSGKPASISRPAGEETETETEVEPSAFPFPPHSPGPSPLAAHSLPPVVDPDHSTPLPNTSNPHANIYIETLSLPRSGPAALYGSVLVRNLAFEKHVALRFTLDDWQTTSEVLCKYAGSLPHLPPPFPRSRTVGDAIGRLANSEGGPQEPKWDRFNFIIHLELYEQKLTEQSLIFVGRFTAPGVGEWWDNNDGQNYRVSFKRPPSSPGAQSQNRSFTAPSTMRPTPVTPTLSVETSVSFPKLSPVLPSPPSLPLPLTSPVLRKVSPTNQPDKTSRPPLAERRGIPGGVNLSQTPQKSVNYVAPQVRVTSPIQTPTPPRSRSGSMEEVHKPFALHPEPKPKSTSAPIFKDGIPMFASPRSSPRSTPPRVASPLPPSLTSSVNTSASSSSSSTPSRSSPTGPMSPLLTELPSSELHEALVKQWCFAQSSPPTPGVFSRGSGSPVEEETPLPKVTQEKPEPSPGPSAWWMGSATGTSGWFNWTSGTQSTTGRIWSTKGRVESPAGLSTVDVKS